MSETGHRGNTMDQEKSRAPLFYLSAALFYFGVLVSLPLVLGAGGCLGTTAQVQAAPEAAIETAVELECEQGENAGDCRPGDPDILRVGSSKAGL